MSVSNYGRVVEAPVADFAHAITAQGEHEKCIHEFQNKIDFLDDEAGRTGRMLTALEAHRLKVVAILAEPSFSEPLGSDLRVALTERFPNSTWVGRFEVRWRP